MTDLNLSPAKKIFVLGDSRTGTLSLNNFFRKHGLQSIHYFHEEAGLSLPLHEHLDDNRTKFMAFVEQSGYQGFTDYPTRTFYRELFEQYPDAYFILTRRDTSDRWEASMRGFLGKFNITVAFDQLRHAYEKVNADIRSLFVDSDRKFLEICVDEDNVRNSQELRSFLGFDTNIMLSRDNATAAIDVSTLSQRQTLYSGEPIDSVVTLERMFAPSKAMFSEYGWIFLANDTNDFLRVQFDSVAWTDSDRERAKDVITTRVEGLKAAKARYWKFIIPEKSVVYAEYLPRAIQHLRPVGERPAQMMAQDNPEIVHYLDKYLTDAKSYGLLYFRGDSHTNWLGAWFVYRYMVEFMQRKLGAPISKPFALADLTPSIAAYDGDLWAQADVNLKRDVRGVLGFTAPEHGFELTTQLRLPEERRKATRVETPADYLNWFTSRETFVYERPDGAGLRAVIFRDSTLDLCQELLAEHFSRSVFIWHNGLVYDEVIEREKPDLVLHVMAERFTTRYLSFPAFADIPQPGS